MICGEANTAMYLSVDYPIKFQQDNATPHVEQTTISRLGEEGIDVMNWPSLSPDLNPVENVWSLIVRKLYSSTDCYDNTDSLWEGIEKTVKAITPEEIQPFIASMPTRLIEVIRQNGAYSQ
jgi:hypothetical protein